MTVLVSGGGLAGLATRLAFKRLGVPCELIDMAPAIPRPELDEPLVLTSNATRVLSRLGLEDLVAKAHTLNTWAIGSANGTQLGGADLGQLAQGGFPTITLQSSELVKALLMAAVDEAPVIRGKARISSSSAAMRIRMAAGIDAIEEMELDGERTVAVSFTAKSMAPKTYSLVVGADGVGSRVRELCVGPVGSNAISVLYPGWGYWWCSVPMGVCVPFLDGVCMREVWARGQRFGVGVLPQGRAFVWGTVFHERPKQLPKYQNRKALAQHFCDAFEHLTPEAQAAGDSQGSRLAQILAHIRGGKVDVQFRYPATVKVEAAAAARQHMAVALVGDAAHATHPAFFQGTAVALQDGFSLAHALVGPGGGLLVGDELRSALRTWRETRRQRGLLAQEASEYVARACKAHEAPSEGQKGFLRSLVAKVTARTLSVDKKALNLWLSKLYAD